MYITGTPIFFFKGVSLHTSFADNIGNYMSEKREIQVLSLTVKIQSRMLVEVQNK